jgi:anti-sigma B factor antagonist
VVDALQPDNAKLETVVSEVSGVPVIKAEGEIDACSANELKLAIDMAMETGARDLIIDLGNVSYMDSNGFTALFAATKQIKSRGGAVNLVACNDSIKRLIKLTCLDSAMQTLETMDAALQLSAE